jgi:biopolymer transport protein ExbB/TolQ
MVMNNRDGHLTLAGIGLIAGLVVCMLTILSTAVQLGFILQNLSTVQTDVAQIKSTTKDTSLDRDRIATLQEQAKANWAKDQAQDDAIKRLEISAAGDHSSIERLDLAVKDLQRGKDAQLRGGRSQ